MVVGVNLIVFGVGIGKVVDVVFEVLLVLVMLVFGKIGIV